MPNSSRDVVPESIGRATLGVAPRRPGGDRAP